MLDVKLQFALVYFAALATCSFLIARVGYSYGTWAATLLVLSLWVLSLAGLGSILGLTVSESGIEWAGMVVIAEFLIFSLGMIFVPMLFLKNCSWVRGRLVGGLTGAAIAAIVVWVIAPNVLR